MNGFAKYNSNIKDYCNHIMSIFEQSGKEFSSGISYRPRNILAKHSKVECRICLVKSIKIGFLTNNNFSKWGLVAMSPITMICLCFGTVPMFNLFDGKCQSDIWTFCGSVFLRHDPTAHQIQDFWNFPILSKPQGTSMQ